MKKVLEGKIVSVKMQNTIIVEVTRKVAHPLYKKLMKRTKRYKIDTAGKEFALGQVVKFVSTKPVSKGKFFKVMEDKK